MSQKAKISAVICELDPLHWGHRLLFRHARERSDALAVVLSGNFVQRGEASALDKWARTRLALENGADLVLELPLPWACAGAERFASGGIRLLNSLGNVDLLFFGSETADLPLLQKAADALLSPEFSRKLAKLPEDGEPFARRREKVLREMVGEEVLTPLRSPNDILAIEYLKALRVEGSPIVPMAFPRQGAGHHERGTGKALRSAGELRELLRRGLPLDGLAPESTAACIEEERALGRCPADLSRLDRAMLWRLRSLTAEDFASLPDVSEGLENRLYAAARQAGGFGEFCALAKTKRYSLARIRRLGLYAALGISRNLPPAPLYLRVLGMNRAGERILAESRPSLPIAARPGDFRKLGGDALKLFRLEARADDLYALACPRPAPCGRDCTEKLIRVDGSAAERPHR